MANQTTELLVKFTGDAAALKGTFDQVNSKSEEAGTSFRKLGNTIAVGMGAVGVGLTAYAKSATSFTEDLVKSSKDLSRETGTSIENASQLVYVAGRMGVSANEASQLFGVFSKNITAATQDVKDSTLAHEQLQNKIDKTKLEIHDTTTEIQKHGDKTGELSLKVRTLNTDLAVQTKALNESTNTFQKLGVKITDANGNTRSFNDILLDTADKFKAMTSGSEKTTTAMQLFGKSGKDLLPVLNQGRDGITELEQRADKLGLTLNAQTIGTYTKYIQSQKNLTDSTNSLKLAVGEVTGPVLTAFNEKVNSVVMSLIAVDSPFRGFTANLLAFGGPALSFGATVIGVAANITTFAVQAGAAKDAVAAFTVASIANLKAFTAAAITPITMPAIATAAVIGSLVLVYDQAVKTLGAFDDLNRSIDANSKSTDMAIASLQKTIKDARARGDQITVARAQKSLQSIADGYRAGGGPVAANTPYIVGETGREMFVPSQAGTILPANQTRDILKGGGGSSGSSTSITFAPQIGMYAGMPSEKRQIAVELYREMVREARAHGVSLPQIGSIPVQ